MTESTEHGERVRERTEQIYGEWAEVADEKGDVAAARGMAKALALCEASLSQAEKQRDGLFAAISSEPPDDHAVRYFQRLHGLPEVGLIGDTARYAALEARLAEAEGALREVGRYFAGEIPPAGFPLGCVLAVFADLPSESEERS